MATTRFADHILKGTTAARPAATAVPAGTIYASSTDGVIYQSDGSSWATWLAAASGAAGALTLLSTTTLASPGAFDVSSISSAYNDLVLVLMCRSTTAGQADQGSIRFNNDSAGNYYTQRLNATAATATAAETIGFGAALLARMPGSTGRASSFAMFEITLPGYASTSWLKTAVWLGYQAELVVSGGLWSMTAGALWDSTAAINRIQIGSSTNIGNLATGSQLRIYGRL